MRSITTLLIALSILLLPCQSFAQIQSTNPQTATRQGEKCSAGRIHVRIKLKTGKKIKGGLLEKTDDAVLVCDKGISRTIATNDIDEINTYLTGKQRAKHIGKVLGVIALVVVFFLIVPRSS